MRNKFFSLSLILITGLILLNSCQKEINGSSNSTGTGGGGLTGMKPKLGTIWTYRYYTYYPILGGGVRTSGILKLKAKTEEIFLGEKWLNVVDVDADTTFYYLQEKADGLYQYANSNAYLLCKFPAVVNDAYTTFNNGSAEDFIVKSVQDTLATGVGNIPVNFYEGTKLSYLIDQFWYNTNAWIVKKQFYLKAPPPSPLYYKYSAMFIESIVY